MSIESILYLSGLGLAIIIGLWIAYESQFTKIETNTRKDTGKVIDLSFKPYESQTNMVPTYVDGKVGMGMSTSSSPEQNMVVLSGEKLIKKVIYDWKSLFEEVTPGDLVEFTLVDIHKVKEGESPNKTNYKHTMIKEFKVAGKSWDGKNSERLSFR